MTTVRILGADEATLLEDVAADVFDGPVDARYAAEFVADPRHHIAVAIVEGAVVGMASAVHYVHPDKPPELWINEVGVAPGFQRQGFATRLIETLKEHGAALGCATAWVLTDEENAPANALYRALGGNAERAVLYEFRLPVQRARLPG